MEKQKRLRFSIGQQLNEERERLELYYEAPLCKIILPDVIDLVKKKAAALPKDFRKSAA